MFRNLFNPESALMVTMAQVTDCIFLSLFWILGCFPVVTIGTSFAALYDATFRGFRESEKHSWQRFLYVFRQNWKGGILPGAVLLLLVGLLVKGVIGLWNGAVYGSISWAVFSGGAFLAVTALGCLSVLMPMLSRFENSLPILLKNTALLSLGNLPRTVVLGAVNAISAMLCIRFVWPVFVLPSLAALLGSFLIEPMFKPYLSEDAV